MSRTVTGVSRLAVFLQTGSAATVAAAAGASYYLGALVGLQLRLPPATPSVLWPPNAILTALLLFVPPRRWWSVLLGGAIAHFAVQLQVWSPGFVAAIFLSNCSEALLAAGVIRYVSGEPTSFDTLRLIAVFLVSGGLVAPFVSSFIDAGIVRMFHGEDYWTVWRIRFPSNVLAQIAIVPAIVGGLNWSHSVREWSARRWLEAAAIAGGLVLVAVAVSLDAGRIGLSRAPLAPFLPLLLWAAVRFGSGGVGLSVLATVLVAVVSVLYGGGLFQEIPPEDRIGLLQVFLISATVPLMSVGALIEERQRVAAALRSSHVRNQTLAARLIVAQEAERQRIARDLHDDLSQKLAVLNIEMNRLGANSLPEVRPSVDAIAALAGEIAEHVHDLSHQLHPSLPEALGLVPAIRSVCGDMSRQHGIAIEIRDENVPLTIDGAVSLCAYRIVQEGLRNVVKHSGATRARVELTGLSTALGVVVVDEGRGVVPEAAGLSGLGLLSMRERVKLLEGEISIQSGPGKGARLDARIPLAGFPSHVRAADAGRSARTRIGD
jgi:signal transduction histidine kinase